jgi:tetratricopeptide (TPR) repeat protein
VTARGLGAYAIMNELQTGLGARSSLPPVPWRDPHTVSAARLQDYIRALEQACADRPDSADARTCLGMAYAMNYEAYKSMDALEAACQINPSSFWARLKYAELHYRLRALPKSEEEMLHALELATSYFEAALARKHLAEIRRLMREGTVRPSLARSLATSGLVLAALSVALCLAVVWK